MITKNDRRVLDFLDKFKVAHTSTISLLYYKSLRYAQIRLTKLIEHEEINRTRYYISREYIYFINRPKQLRHKLLLTDFYRECIKLGLDVQYFEPEVGIEHLKPDAIMVYKYKNNYYISFIEIEISNKGLDLDKYKQLYYSESYKKYFPTFPQLIIVTNRKIEKCNDFKIINIDEYFTNMKQIIS